MHRHEASRINACRTCRLLYTQEICKHQQMLHLQLIREHAGLCTPMGAHLPPLACICSAQATPEACLHPQTLTNHHVLHLQIFWEPRPAIIMSQRLADRKLMAAGMKQPHLPYQVITAEAAEILQVMVLSGCLPGADALPLYGLQLRKAEHAAALPMYWLMIVFDVGAPWLAVLDQFCFRTCKLLEAMMAVTPAIPCSSLSACRSPALRWWRPLCSMCMSWRPSPRSMWS